MERKSFIGIDLKSEKPGMFTARIATLNVVDKDGDVTIPGAFPVGKSILISAYQHGSWQGGLPVGKGIIREVGDEVLVDGEFNLNSETGKEHYETVKFAPELQEWSFGFIASETEEGAEWNGVKVARIIKKLDIFEASPVLRGAGVNTATLAVKSEGTPFADDVVTALATVQGIIERTKSLADLRKKEGRTLSQAILIRLSDLRVKLLSFDAELKALLETKQKTDEGIKELLSLYKTHILEVN